MPRFIIERNFAEQLELTKDAASQITKVDQEEGVEWVFSFVSADKKKTYCLYEAPNADALKQSAKRLNMPADNIVEVGGEVRPDMFV